MSRHRPESLADTAAKTDLDAATDAAHAELKRRQAYKHLVYLEGRISEYAPVPGDSPYVETFPNLDPDKDKS
jgi:hypothetical protein